MSSWTKSPGKSTNNYLRLLQFIAHGVDHACAGWNSRSSWAKACRGHPTASQGTRPLASTAQTRIVERGRENGPAVIKAADPSSVVTVASRLRNRRRRRASIEPSARCTHAGYTQVIAPCRRTHRNIQRINNMIPCPVLPRPCQMGMGGLPRRSRLSYTSFSKNVPSSSGH